MTDVLRAARWPAPGFTWRALALYLGPVVLLVANVLPTIVLLGRLPRYVALPHQQTPTFYLGDSLLSGALLAAAWAGLLGAARMARRSDRRLFWELWVPLLYGLGGYLGAGRARDLLLNLGQPSGQRTTLEAPQLLAMLSAALVCAGVGLLLGRRAEATEPVSRAGARAVWISDVDADLRWWLMQAIVALGACLLVALPSALTGSWAGALQADAVVLGCILVVAAWASRGHVRISPWGVRFHYGHVPLLGWQCSIDRIASVEVGRVRLLRSAAAWQCLGHLALRDGPALILRTRSGSRHVVTLPGAEDAAVTLRTWIAQRGVTPS